MAKQTFTSGQVLTAAQMTSLQQTAMLGGDASAKTSSYTLVAADAGTAISMSNASATTITVNTGLFAAGDIVTIVNLGAGVCTITAGTATVATSGSLALAQNQGGVLRFTSASAAIFFQFATPASGDIEGVTAGTGLSGGGTSGTVTLSLSSPVVETLGGTAQTTYATGDLLYASASNTLAKRSIGTTGQVLTVSGGVPTWATPAGGGKVLQVVYASTTTETTNNTTTYADTTLTANITPSSTSSRILVMVVQGGCTKDAGSASAGFDMQVRRGATGIGYFAYDSMKTSTAFSMRSLTFPMNIVDSPATTSSLTYKTQFRNMVSGSTVTVQSDGLPSTIVLLEIGA